jgi:hypothetical protein
MLPIFMIGTQRSGSHLLRLMLNELPEVAAPHPPHILQRIMPLVPGYGDLSDDENFSQLVDDICRLVEVSPVPWERVGLDRKKIVRRCRERSVPAVQGAVYDVCAETKGALNWCCTSLSNIHFSTEIESYFRSPKYIYLYRDGRDVAVSLSKAIASEKHFYHIARDWAATQELALALRKKIGQQRFVSISYEELTAYPELTARFLCAFLDLTYRESMLDHYRTEEAMQDTTSSALCKDVTRPVMPNNNRKFLREAATWDIAIFESVAGHVLDALGYARTVVQPGEELTFSEEEILAFDEENRKRQEEFRKFVDPARLIRRDLQSGLLKTVKERLAQKQAAATTPTRLPPVQHESDTNAGST